MQDNTLTERCPVRRGRWWWWLLAGGVVVGAGLVGWFASAPGDDAQPVALAEVVGRGAAAGFDVLLITLDTTRADRIGCYGYAGARTPALDGLAACGVRFDHAVSSAPTTLPSHATILTGLNPLQHGVHQNGLTPLQEQHVTLAERLGQEGYATAAFVSSYVLDRRFGLGQGFDAYEFAVGPGLRGDPESLVHERRADATTTSALGWLRDREKVAPDAPFFLWVHYFDPHYTYDSPLGGSADFADQPYDAEIAFADLHIRRLLDALEKSGQRNRTLIVVASDHGESLHEHGEAYHGVFLYEPTMHAVLILSCPSVFERAYRVDDRLVGTIDIHPTVLELLGLPVPEGLDGISLLASDPPVDRSIYIETHFSRLFGCQELFGLRRLHDKYILAPTPEYYDLRRDPKEQNNLYADSPPSLAGLEASLAGLLDSAGVSVGVSSPLAMDAEVARRLGALGYVGGAEVSRTGPLPDPKDQIALINQTTEVGILIGAERYAEALPLAQELVSACEAYDLPVRQLADIYMLLDRPDDAIATVGGFVGRYPSVEMLVYLAKLQFAAGNHDACSAALDAAEGLDPACGAVVMLRGDLASAEGRFGEAIVLFERALELDSQRLGPEVRVRLRQARSRAAGTSPGPG
ncbi:MAG: sulfatase-like hydrolase/transferase [bacterium]|nr:sulfatase-like hydrolase/transferase [bacterium]